MYQNIKLMFIVLFNAMYLRFVVCFVASRSESSRIYFEWRLGRNSSTIFRGSEFRTYPSDFKLGTGNAKVKRKSEALLPLCGRKEKKPIKFLGFGYCFFFFFFFVCLELLVTNFARHN
jgi:hypothetical protein